MPCEQCPPGHCLFDAVNQAQSDTVGGAFKRTDTGRVRLRAHCFLIARLRYTELLLGIAITSLKSWLDFKSMAR